MEIFSGHISKILENREINYEEGWYNQGNARMKLKELACATDNYVINSAELNVDWQEELILAKLRGEPGKLLDQVESSAHSLMQKVETPRICVVFFVKDAQSRVWMENALDSEKWKQLKMEYRRMDHVFVIVQEYIQQNVKLRNLKRFEVLQMPPISGAINLEDGQEQVPERLHAIVLNIDLYQMVQLYNTVGDQLFQNNVRLGIHDTLDVDRAIQETLKYNPEQFWFRNNGITILVKTSEFSMSGTEELLLGQLDPTCKLNFSVVNGAQTLSAAAQYFYSMEYIWKGKENTPDGKRVKDTWDKAVKSAYVLLRIICVPENSETDSEVKKISVALNRQKPITTEDIAFTIPHVEKLTKYLQAKYRTTDEAGFLLARRGENVNTNQMTLVEFARARMACAEKPGDARTKGQRELLDYQPMGDGTYTFRQKVLFANDWITADTDEEEERIFRRDYSAVWFAHRIAREYEKHRRTIAKEMGNILGRIISNGKWYFTALVIQVSNAFHSNAKRPDFSFFTGNFDAIRENIPEIMYCFAHLAEHCASQKSELSEINSNIFKNESLYQDIILELKGGSLDCAIKFRQLLYLVSEGASSESEPVGHSDQPYIVLGGKCLPVQGWAQAMAKTAAYVLEISNADKNQLERFTSWLWAEDADNVPVSRGILRHSRSMSVNARPYRVYTFMGNDAKKKKIGQLCEQLNMNKGTIKWYLNGVDKSDFCW